MLDVQLIRICIRLQSFRIGQENISTTLVLKGKENPEWVKIAEEEPNGTSSQVLGRTFHDIHDKEILLMLAETNSLKRQVKRIKSPRWSPNPTSLHGVEIPEAYKVTRNGESFLINNSSAQDERRILIYTTYENIWFYKYQFHIIQWWHLQDGTNTVHSVAYSAWCSMRLYYAIDLCTNNEEARRHLQMYIWKYLHLHGKEISTLTLHCAWWILKLQIWMWFDYSYQMHE